jgi:outer membrane protein TolC
VDSTLRLGEVLRAVERHFPGLLAAREEIARAEGSVLAAEGAFDTRLEAAAGGDLRGFYEHDLFDIGMTKRTTAGGLELSGGYRLGRGDFAVWDKGLQTNGDGEARLALRFPLLRGRSIDTERERLWQARIERAKADPDLEALVIATRRDAAFAYWRWVAAGERLRIAERLLQFAEDRAGTMQVAVDEGLLPRIDLIDNQRLIAERRAIRIRAERGLEREAIGLSLYLRDTQGEPSRPRRSQLPSSFPALPPAGRGSLEEAVELALLQRPELESLRRERERIELAGRKARNDLLPRVDLHAKGSQDYGVPASVPDDKGEFELTAGIGFSFPLERREARGVARKNVAELRRLDHELRLLRDRIALDVADAVSARTQARSRIEEARISVELARELESAERFQLEEGNSDLLRLNLREQQSAQAAAFLVDVTEEFFEAWTRYRAVVGDAAHPERLIP